MHKRQPRGGQSCRRLPASVGSRQTSLQCQHSPPSSETRLSVFWGWGLIVTPQGPVTGGYPPPPSPSLHTHPSSPSSRGRDSPQTWVQASWFFISKILSIAAWAGPGESLWLLPPSPSISCPLRNEPRRRPAKLKILKRKPLPRGCPASGWEELG